MATLRFRSIAQLSRGEKLLDRYKVQTICYRSNVKFVCRAHDLDNNKRVLLIIVHYCSIRLYPHVVLRAFVQRLIDVKELPFAKIHHSTDLGDAHMMVMENEGPLACEVVKKSGKMTKNNTLSICISLLYCMETLTGKGYALTDIRSSGIIWNTEHRVASKALLTDFTQVFYVNDKYLHSQLIQLVYMFFDLWCTDVEDVYNYSLRQIGERHSEFSNLIEHVLTLEEQRITPDFEIVRHLFENLIE